MTRDEGLLADVNPSAEDEDDDEEMPRVQVTRRNLVLGTVFIVSIVAFMYFVLPQLGGLEDTWHRIEDGDPLWLIVAFLFTLATFGAYVLLFQGVYVRGGCSLTVAESYQITMAGLAATRLFAAGGAGGIALTAWALRRAGMKRRQVADRTIAFLVLQYGVYMAALVIGGLGLRYGLFEGRAPWTMTVLPAIVGAIAIAVFLLMSLTPTDLQRRMEGYARRHGRLARLLQRLANLPASASAGTRYAIAHLRDRDPAIVGAVAFWGFQIACLWASFRAFGESPPWAVLVMGFFVGMMANLLPLPGGVGGVDGGMIGAFVAFDVPFESALVAVLTYRAFAFWLPTIPGALAYFQLRKTVARWREERRARSGAIQSEATPPGDLECQPTR